MPLIVQQIQTRFKFFQIFWLIEAILAPILIVLSEYFNVMQQSQTKQIVEGVNPTLTFNITFVLIFFGVLFVSLIISITGTVFYAMLTHGIYNYLKLNKGSKVNPTWAVWSIFIPVGGIFVALNAKDAFKSLKLDSPTPKNYLYYAIFSLIATTILVFGNIFYTFYELFNSELKPVILKPFMNQIFYISILSTVISLGLFYFIWKVMKEMKDAIVSENVI
jgi:hypothetical protein